MIAKYVRNTGHIHLMALDSRLGRATADTRPGAICYARGGTPPTIKDANAAVGYYPDPSHRRQDAAEYLRLNIEGARAAFQGTVVAAADCTPVPTFHW